MANEGDLQNQIWSRFQDNGKNLLQEFAFVVSGKSPSQEEIQKWFELFSTDGIISRKQFSDFAQQFMDPQEEISMWQDPDIPIVSEGWLTKQGAVIK